MAHVFLGLGSNIERERYLVAGLDAMRRLFIDFRYSSVYDSASVGFDGQAFLNMVIEVETDLSLSMLAKALRKIEVEHGRPADATRFSARQLDIDILTYDDCVGTIHGVVLPRPEILENAFVLQPLAELAPLLLHPQVEISYSQLWEEYDQGSQQLCKVDFQWAGRPISVGQN
ncbi:MAG: 2-amino-4-hydroxy-6-hydroxymethyldihydropteridine diphosphokinase [Halioglobus sp.]|jgi:2-amino-4-hydroxy-6-hydroxymethyldihydropteridine diphosphokinase